MLSVEGVGSNSNRDGGIIQGRRGEGVSSLLLSVASPRNISSYIPIGIEID